MRSRVVVILMACLPALASANGREIVEQTLLRPLMATLNKSNGSPLILGKSYQFVQELPGDETARIVIRPQEQGPMTAVLQVREEATRDPLSLVSKLMLLEHMFSEAKSQWKDPKLRASHIFAASEFVGFTTASWELLSNVEQGSLSAKTRLIEARLGVIRGLSPSKALLEAYSRLLGQPVANVEKLIRSRLSAEADYLEQEILPRLKQASLEAQNRQKRNFDRARSQDERLKAFEAQAEKFNDLLLKNDRKGVADMLNAYLPWSLMEPSERRAWEGWLEAIRNPDPHNQVVGFRGVDQSTDFVQRARLLDGTERFAFMSTVLTQNQGNYTRRLRSLATRREANGDHSFRLKATDLPHVTLTQTMWNHAIEPTGSNFLSFTTNPEIAESFIGERAGGFLVVKMDARRLFPNLANSMVREAEYLAPLVVFPDEVVEFIKGDNQSIDREAIDEVVEKVRRLNLNYRPTEPEMTQLRRFQQGGLKFLVPTFSPQGGQQCRAVFH